MGRGHAAHLVLGDGVDAQGVEDVARGRLAGQLPLLLLDTRQVVRGVDVARVPLAVHVLLEAGAFPGGREAGLAAFGAALKGLCAHARGEGGVSLGHGGLHGGAVGRGVEDVDDVDGCGRVSASVLFCSCAQRAYRSGGRAWSRRPWRSRWDTPATRRLRSGQTWRGAACLEQPAPTSPSTLRSPSESSRASSLGA